jgi:tRNA (cytidine/uridine-2'-O-)-methyltransferase
MVPTPTTGRSDAAGVSPIHQRRHVFPFLWPERPLNIVLVEPEIPPNTGAIARLCAATGSRLHLVGPLGFRLTDAKLRRAGLDYWENVDMARHSDLATCLQSLGAPTAYFFSTRATRRYTGVRYHPGDTFVFGSESRGLPDTVLDSAPDRVLGIPILTEHVRSLNLATAAAIVLYEALRQIDRPRNDP